MEQFIINIKDTSKSQVFLDAVLKMEFVEVLERNQMEKTEQNATDDYDFFQSAGLWKDRKIEAQELRKQAWKKSS